MKSVRKRVLSLVTAAALAAGSFTMPAGVFPSLTVPAGADGTWSKFAAGVTTLGTSGIGSPIITTNLETLWRGSYVYYGKFDGTNATKYRVLDPNSNAFQITGGSLFLDCDTMIAKVTFNNSYEDGNAWQGSNVQSWLKGNDFLNKNGNFTSIEKNAIAVSKTNIEAGTTNYMNNTNLDANGEQVFLLDVTEVTNTSYGYDDNFSRRKKSSDYGDGWWLRSSYTSAIDEAGYVNRQYGNVGRFTVNWNLRVSPAFNVSRNAVLFASQVNDATGTYGKEYKLTLKDSNTTIVPGTLTRSGNTVTVPYTVTDSTPNDGITADTVSVLITDAAGTTVKLYTPLSGTFSTTGSGSFTLPSTYATTDKVYILAEDVNSQYLTDYASDMVPLHIHSWTYAAGSGTDANKITATCGGSGTCGITSGLTMTISAPTGSLVYDGTAKTATLNTGYSTTAFPGTYTITYTKQGDTSFSGTPSDAGTYTASVTAGTGTGAATASVVYEITPAPQDKPAAPTKASSTRTTLTLTTVEGCEYKRDDGEWQDSPTFTDLTEGTSYTFYQRLKADGNHDASDPSDGALLKTTIPAVNYTVTFKVKNGEWNDGTTADKTVILSRREDEDKLLGLGDGDIPAVGSKPAKGYTAGAWDTVPTTNMSISSDKTYTYTYAALPYCPHYDTEVRDKAAATCMEEGYTGDTYCKNCGKKISSGTVTAALGHRWGKAEYVWSDDLSACTGTSVCKRSKSHTATETVNTTSEVTKAAWCTTKGVMTYTAGFTSEAFKTQTKTGEIPALGHDRDENGKCRRCGDTPSRGPSGGGSTPTTPTTTTTTTSEPELDGDVIHGTPNRFAWKPIPDAKSYSLWLNLGGKSVFLQDQTETFAEFVYGADGKIYLRNGDKFDVYTYGDGKLTKTGSISADKIDTVKVKNNVTNEFVVKCKSGGKTVELKVSVKTYYKPAVKATATKDGALLKWEKVDGATKYRLSKLVNGKLKKVADVNGTAINLTGLKSGKEYTYAVKALANNEWTTVWKSDLVTVTAK